MNIRVLPTAGLSDADRIALRRLLNAAYDGDFTDDDFDHALGGWHVIAGDVAAPISHAAVVARSLFMHCTSSHDIDLTARIACDERPATAGSEIRGAPRSPGDPRARGRGQYGGRQVIPWRRRPCRPPPTSVAVFDMAPADGSPTSFSIVQRRELTQPRAYAARHDCHAQCQILVTQTGEQGMKVT